MDSDKKFIGGWWVWILGLMVVTTITFAVLNAVGVVGRTVVEREVFERSFQYSEARKAEIAKYEAQLAEIGAQLLDPALDETTKNQLKATAAAIRVRLQVAQEAER